MGQRKQLTWTELRVGLFVLVGLFILAVGIFYVTGSGGIFSPKYRLKTFLPEVEGLEAGAPVRLDGVEIGNVDVIRIAPRVGGKVPDPEKSIEVVMRLKKSMQNEVRTDSYASLVTEGLLGNRYVSVHRGLTGKPLTDWQELEGREEKAMKQVVERSADVLANLNTLSAQVSDLIGGVQRGKGTLGKMLTDEQAYVHFNSILARSDKIVSEVQAGHGTLGKIVATDEVYEKLDKAVGRADTLLADVQAQKGTIGKLMYDPSVYDNAKQTIEKANALVTDVQAGKGTLGKLVTDDALYAQVRDSAANVKEITEKLNKNGGTGGKFISDPQFYDNLTGAAADLRLLLGEFRQNPKRFLRIKLAIF